MHSSIRAVRLHTVVAVFLLAVGTLACGSSPTSPTSPALVTETITGTVVAGSFDGRQFPVAAEGVVTVTLLSLAPQATITMGIGIGQQDPLTGTCLLFGQNETFRVGGAPLSGSFPPGTYCFVLYDVGNVSGSVSYSLTLSHP